MTQGRARRAQAAAFRRRTRHLAGFLAVSLALAGCGSAAKIASSRRQTASSHSTTSSTLAPASGESSTSTTEAGSPATSGRASSSTATTNPPPGPAGGPQPAATGTYSYDQTGCFSESSTSNCSTAQQYPAQGTDVVDAATTQGPGSWTQVWGSYLDTSQPPSSTTFSITPSGIAIASEVIRMSADGQSVTFTCSFPSPVEVLDWPPTVGHQFSGSGTCTSTDNSYGSFTVRVSGSINGTEQTSIGGSPTTAYVISTTAQTTGSVTSTTTETDWFDPGPDIDLYESSQQSGSYEGLVSFSSAITRTLVSTHPG